MGETIMDKPYKTKKQAKPAFQKSSNRRGIIE
jgi:hypothetical protein